MKKITKQTKYLGTEEYFNLFKHFIKDTSKGNRKNSNGSKIKVSTIDTYHYIYLLLEEFAKEKEFELRIYIVKNLNTRDKESAKSYHKKFFKQFTEFLYRDKDYYDNYVGLVVKGLRTFYNYIKKEHLIDAGEFHKDFYAPSENIPIIVLNPDHLNYLINNAELDKILPKHLIKVKDIFVFGCTVALRYSDLMALTKNNLQEYNNQAYLKVTSIKTNTDTTIKLPDYAIQIIKKYYKQQKTLFPSHSNAWLNKCLKELVKYLNFNEPAKKYRTKRGIKVEVYKNKETRESFTMADHITTHTMRRTAITTMLRMGMPEQAVRKISGHAPNSKEFFKYVEFSQAYIDEHTDKVFEKLTKLVPEKSAIFN